MMHAKNTILGTRDHSWFMQCCALLLGAWLFVTPQVMYSNTVMDLCEEAGGSTLPLIEEEVAKHVSTQPPGSFLSLGSMAAWDSELPSTDDRPLGSLHGEVPHLPPWC